MRKAPLYAICLVVVAAVTGGSRASAATEIPRDPNLVIFYSYDKVGLTVPDESGRGHHGTVCGDVSAAPSGIKWYGAAQFLGEWGPTKYSYLDLDSSHYPAADIPRSAITLAAWVKCRKTGKDHAILSCRSAKNVWVVHPQINDNGSFRWLLRTPDNATIYNMVAGTHGWDEWLHYAGTYDSATGKMVLYIDGAVCATYNAPRGQLIADWGTGARVGYNIDNARPFTGVMDELYLFTRALSEAEVNALLAAEGLPSLKATHPNPADGAELDTTAAVLEWLPGAYAATNNVYFGTSFADVNNGAGNTLKGKVAEAKYAVSDLAWGTTYYWRIDGVNAVNPDSPWKGDVWRFLVRPSTAWNPTPADGAKWIDTNADLSWNPGRGAVMHYVYFGDKRDVVANATGALPQTKTTYDPGVLGFEKVYYWRVDEFDGTTTRKGNVWSFTTLGAGSGLKGQYYKDMELKTLVLTRIDPGINFNWGAAAPDPLVPAENFSVRWTGELEVPFTAEWTFTANCDDCVRLWVNDQLLFNKWGEQSGVEWIGSLTLVAGQKYSIVMEYYENTGDARAVLYWNSPSWLTPYQPKQAIPQGAFSPPLAARSPQPAHRAVDVPQTAILQWTAGDKATAHDVYFGVDANAVANANAATKDIYRGRQALDATSFNPGPLEWNKTYYWRVDEVNGAAADSPWKGTVWSFTTADFLVVDDMESYTDEEGHRIYEAWLDNFDPKGDGSGSTVGNDPAPFAEQTIVHGGRQSLPMAFNNAGPKYLFSEIVRTFESPQDWTINGVKTLTVFVRGVTTNQAAPFYVALEDKAGKVGVVANADAALLTKAEWVEWKVPLTSFTGVNAAAVKKMYLGVGSRTAPKAGGNGKLYLDDIRVVKP
ncbi:MAG: PA14 domain-containing protein [Planctomycetes bacterium]|jgi:hypothetical protein|nr:PA14 domain-containing protein [Planctomycetota bacterium]